MHTNFLFKISKFFFSFFFITGSTAIIRELRAGPCTSVPCPFVRGNTYSIEFTAMATASATSLPFIVNATILGQPWTIMEGNGCDQLSCPTAANVDFTFRYDYEVSTIFPPVWAIFVSFQCIMSLITYFYRFQPLPQHSCKTILAAQLFASISQYKLFKYLK